MRVVSAITFKSGRAWYAPAAFIFVGLLVNSVVFAQPSPSPSASPSAPPAASSSAPPAASSAAASDTAPPAASSSAPPAASSNAPPAGSDVPSAPPPPANSAGMTTVMVGGKMIQVQAPGTPVQKKKKRITKYTTWDANLDGAIGYSWEGANHLSGFGRARAGILFVNEEDIQAPHFYTLGATYEFSEFSPATFGLQFEHMSLNSGTWFQLGALVDIQPRPGFMIAGGLSLLGVEAQVRWAENEGAFFAIYGKLRIPISIIAIALSKR